MRSAAGRFGDVFTWAAEARAGAGGGRPVTAPVERPRKAAWHAAAPPWGLWCRDPGTGRKRVYPATVRPKARLPGGGTRDATG